MGVFVVQVISGQEDRAAALIAKLAQGAVEDCFVPKREVAHRKSGQWHRILEKLFPGYVFVRTSASKRAREVLGRVPAFTRMLTSAGDTCLPLTADEVAWINATTNMDTHVMEMSEGVIEGDRVVVIRGPLKGREASITRVDRHKRLAWVDMNMFGRNKTIRVGLEIVSKR
ncbi:MAG: antiterminator LoaP [Collinsella sp.]